MRQRPATKSGWLPHRSSQWRRFHTRSRTFGSSFIRGWCTRNLLPLAAHSQMADPDSLFHFYKAMLAWRRGFEVLRTGSIELLAEHDAVLAFVRRSGDAALLCAFNMGSDAVRYALPAGMQVRSVETPSGLSSGSQHGQDLVLPPYGVLFAAL